MDDYASFIETSLRDIEPHRVARQKDSKNRIKSPFRIDDATAPPTAPRTTRPGRR